MDIILLTLKKNHNCTVLWRKGKLCKNINKYVRVEITYHIEIQF
jgi:hypothetical protein